MDLLTLIQDTTRRAALAKEVGTSPAYLWQVARGWRGKRASPELASAIERATGGEIRAADLRPDIAAMFAPPASEQPQPEGAAHG